MRPLRDGLMVIAAGEVFMSPRRKFVLLHVVGWLGAAAIAICAISLDRPVIFFAGAIWYLGFGLGASSASCRGCRRSFQEMFRGKLWEALLLPKMCPKCGASLVDE